MQKFLFFFLFSSFAQASILLPKQSNSQLHLDTEEIITSKIYEELYKRSYKFPLKVKKKKSLNRGKRGKLIIEEMKQRNREKLALKRGVDPSKVKSGADIVNLQRDDNKEMNKKLKALTKSEEWQALAAEEIYMLKKKVLLEHKAWRKKHLPTLKEWQAKREDYLKTVDNYKDNLSEIPLVLPVSKEEQGKKIDIKIKKEFKFAASALGLYIRDQKQRATCSSFSGVRATEVLLAQNKKMFDLSEQYFYFSSKEKCQTKACSIKGSFVGHGFNYSKKQAIPNIPLEQDCPYSAQNLTNNETQIPLINSCSKGAVKIKKFKYIKTLDQVINELDQNRTVTLGLSLTPNFYKNEGVIFASDKNSKNKMDQHARGHTVLIVGYLKLPQVFNEGSVCFIVANSWGAGWGHGGYSCLSEKYISKQRNPNPFVSITALEI